MQHYYSRNLRIFWLWLLAISIGLLFPMPLRCESTTSLLRQLHSHNASVWEHAADTLAGRRELRAIPSLLSPPSGQSLEEKSGYYIAAMGPGAVPFLLDALSHGNAATRINAVNALRPTHDPRKIAALLTALKDKNATVRMTAAYALSTVGIPNVPALLNTLNNNDPYVRASVVAALGEINDIRARAPLLALLQNDDLFVPEVLNALTKFAEPPYQLMLVRLHDPRSQIRIAAINALAHCTDPQVVGDLLSALKDPDATVRRTAIHIFAYSHNTNIIQALRALLPDPDNQVRREVISVLSTLGTMGIDALLPLTQSTDSALREIVLRELAHQQDQRIAALMQTALLDTAIRIRLLAEDYFQRHRDIHAVPILLQSCATAKGIEREEIYKALGEQRDTQIVPALLSAMEDASFQQKFYLKDALIEIHDKRITAYLTSKFLIIRSRRDLERQYAGSGKIAEENAEDLKQRTDDDLRQIACSVFGRYRDQEALALLLSALSSPEPIVREHAIEALGNFGPAMVPSLLPALHDPRAEICIAAASALGQIGEISAIDPLIAVVKDHDSSVRYAVLAALNDIGDVRANPVFADAVYDPDANCRQEATSDLPCGNPSCVPALLHALHDRNRDVRYSATRACRVLVDRRTVPSLILLLHDADGTIRKQAAEALGQIGDKQASLPLLALLHDDATGAVHEALLDLNDPCIITPLLHELKTATFSQQKVIIAVLTNFTDPRLEEPLSEIIRNAYSPYDEMVQHAASALGRQGKAGLEILLALAKDNDPSWREVAIQGLIVSDGHVAQEALHNLLHDEDAHIRCAVVEKMAQSSDPDAIKAIIAVLHDADSAARRAALDALWYKPDQQAIASLLSVLKDDEVDLRNAAAYRLSEMHASNAADLLLDFLNNGPTGKRDGAIEALGELHDFRAFDTTLALANECNKDSFLSITQEQVLSVVALGKFSDKRATELLLNIVQNWIYRSNTYSGYGNCGMLVSAAIHSLGMLKDPRSVEPLIALTQENTMFTFDAAKALGSIGQPQALAYLQQAITDANYEKRQLGALGLGATGDVNMLPILTAALHDPHWRVRESAAEGLGLIHDAQAIVLLQQTAHDIDGSVRIRAVQSLGASKDRRVLATIAEALTDYDYDVREAAMHVLEQYAGLEFDGNVARCQEWWKAQKQVQSGSRP